MTRQIGLCFQLHLEIIAGTATGVKEVETGIKMILN
jgi:hypothetical protein